MKKPARSTGLIGRVRKALMIMVTMMIAKDMSARAVKMMSAIADTITIIMVLNLAVVISAFLQTNVVVRRCAGTEVRRHRGFTGTQVRGRGGTRAPWAPLLESPKVCLFRRGSPEIAQRNLVNGCSGK